MESILSISFVTFILFVQWVYNCQHSKHVKFEQNNNKKAKLRNRIEGGVAGLELAKSQRETQASKGDAEGHLTARAISMATKVATSGSQWLAGTGTGALLEFVKGRNMKVALLPKPLGKNDDDTTVAGEGNRMEQLVRQLPKIKFDVVIKSGDEAISDKIATEERETITRKSISASVLNTVLAKTNIPPISTLVVSDKDDYLEMGRSLGMYTCRIHVPNTRKGSASSHFVVNDISEVKTVVNELNGVSFTSVMGSVGIDYGGV